MREAAWQKTPPSCGTAQLYDKVARIMGRCELLVTKPGALTCTEAIVMNKPMVLVNTLPGQERANAAVFKRTRLRGMGETGRTGGNGQIYPCESRKKETNGKRLRYQSCRKCRRSCQNPL